MMQRLKSPILSELPLLLLDFLMEVVRKILQELDQKLEHLQIYKQEQLFQDYQKILQ